MARDDYVGLLSTVSAWLELPTVRRTAALDAVRAVARYVSRIIGG